MIWSKLDSKFPFLIKKVVRFVNYTEILSVWFHQIQPNDFERTKETERERERKIEFVQSNANQITNEC